MTGNELADKLMESNSVSWGSCTHEQHDNDKYFKEQAATMLRQQAEEIEQLREELALQKLSDIGQEIEDRDSAIYATGYWNGIEYKKQHDELQTLVKSFFEDYLNYQEESDNGRVFNPIHVSCTRAMMIEPLAKLLMRMRELSKVKE